MRSAAFTLWLWGSTNDFAATGCDKCFDGPNRLVVSDVEGGPVSIVGKFVKHGCEGCEGCDNVITLVDRIGKAKM